jgi:pyruvate formate lyase activating enzyme
VIFAEYAIDTAVACHAQGVATVAVTAGYIHPEARRDFYAVMDAANVDLKAFTDDFYVHQCGAHLAPVLDTLAWLHHETDVWVEITTLLIPGLNDSDAELTALAKWVATEMGPDVPLHFTAFHPDYKLDQLPPTPPATLSRARRIARDAGLHYVYTGNVHDPEGGTTYCPGCGQRSSSATGTPSSPTGSTPTAPARPAATRLPAAMANSTAHSARAVSQCTCAQSRFCHRRRQPTATPVRP